jgi:Flp pilus assembly protein TadD
VGRATAARLWPAAALALLALAAYGQAGGFAFLGYDDNRYVTGNEVVRRGLTPEGLRWAFTTTWDGNWFPLTWLSHELDVQLFGVRPGGPHLVNLGLHVATAILLAGLLRSLTGRRLPGLFAAAVFAVHPLQAETVAWVSQRRGALMALFGVLALRAYAGYARRPGAGRYAAVAALFACGLASKALLVTLPLLMLLLDLWPLGRLRPGAPRDPRPFLEKLPLLLLSGVFGAVAVWAQRTSGAMSLEGRIAPAQKAAHALAACGWYLGKALWPSGLAVFYPYPLGGDPPWRVALGSAALVGITAAALLLRRRAPAVGVGWLWFLVALAPALGLLQVGEQAWADRYAYFALPGLAIAAAWGAAALAPRRAARLLPALAAAVALALTAAAAAQARHWRDNETLFTRAAAVTEGNFVAQNNLGTILLEQGRVGEAIERYREAARLRPDQARTRSNLGAALLRAGRLQEAAAALREATRLDPAEAEAHYNLGLVLDRLGRPAEAVVAYRGALRLQPRDLPALSALGATLLQLGRPGEAVAPLALAAQLAPGDPFVRGTLALAEAQLGRGAPGAAK